MFGIITIHTEQMFRTSIEQRMGDFMSRIAVYRTERELRSYRRKIRRQKEIRRNLILLVAAVLALMLFAVSFHSITAFASNNTEDVSYKYFKSIQSLKKRVTHVMCWTFC